MDINRIERFLDFMNEINKKQEEPSRYVFQYEDFVFRKISGENFPEQDKTIFYSVHGLTGGIRFIIVVSLMMGTSLRVQYFHENNVKQGLFDAVNQFEKSYLRLVYDFWQK